MPLDGRYVLAWLAGRRHRLSAAALAVLLGLALLAPPAAAACELIDPGCYIDAFARDQMHELSLSIWQINRAGLILARWIEDLRGWLIESMLVSAFDSLKLPAVMLFHLALIVAWMVFVISYMVQSLIDLRWVDIRRAMRPVLLAFLVYQLGGVLLKQSEHVRQVGGSLLQQAGQAAMQAAGAPRVPAQYVEGRAELKSIYSVATCVTAVRPVNALALNDYAAHYLLAEGDDIHCADLMSLAQTFRTQFFSTNNVADVSNDAERRLIIAQAAQGSLRQITGLFMTGGAIIEQVLHLLFALALALVWFGLLISLVFAVFLPSEALFAQQIRAMLAVLRASWLASLLLGIGLAALRLVADTGNGLLMLVGGLMLIALCLWQGRQALAMMQLAGTSSAAALGGAPQAVGGMLRSWATTGALAAGAVATGGMGSTTAQIGAALARRMGRNAGDNPLARAAGRVLSRRIVQKLDTLNADRRIEQEVDLSQAEAAWYERAADAGMADAPARARAARRHAHRQRALLLDRRAARARQARDFATADRLRRTADAVRAKNQRAEPTAGDVRTTEVSAARQARSARVIATPAPASSAPPRADQPRRAPALRRAQLATLRRHIAAPVLSADLLIQPEYTEEPRTAHQAPLQRVLAPGPRHSAPQPGAGGPPQQHAPEPAAKHPAPLPGAGEPPQHGPAPSTAPQAPPPIQPAAVAAPHRMPPAGIRGPSTAHPAAAAAPHRMPPAEIREAQQRPLGEQVLVDYRSIEGIEPVREHTVLHNASPQIDSAPQPHSQTAAAPLAPAPGAMAALPSQPLTQGALPASTPMPAPQPRAQGRASLAGAGTARPEPAPATPGINNRGTRATLALPTPPSLPAQLAPARAPVAPAAQQPWKRRKRGDA